jgi:hypothetical protein
MPEAPKPRGKLLEFPADKQRVHLQSGLMVENLIASNLQLAAVLRHLCGLFCDVLEGEEVTNSDELKTELHFALSEAARLNEIIDENTCGL